MAASGSYMAVAIKSTVDMSTYQYRVVEVDGTLGVSPSSAIGIAQDHPTNVGLGVTVGYHGQMKGYAGGTITAGAGLTVSSGGWLTAYTAPASGAISPGRVGKALVAASSGGLVEGLFDFTAAGSNGGI